MIVKNFKQNENGKIEFTKNELKQLLDEIYNAGYADGAGSDIFTYTAPDWTYLKNTFTYTPHIVVSDKMSSDKITVEN